LILKQGAELAPQLYRGMLRTLYPIAQIYAGLGERDQAIEWPEKAYEERATSIIFTTDEIQ